MGTYSGLKRTLYPNWKALPRVTREPMGYGFWTTTGAPRTAGAETWLAGSFANGVGAWAGGGWTGEE